MGLLVYEVLACFVVVVLGWLFWGWMGGGWRAAVFAAVCGGLPLAVSLRGELRGRVVAWWARVRLAWWARRWPRLPQREPLTPCRECGKVLPYPCATPLCDGCLSEPTREELQQQADAMAARWRQASADADELRAVLLVERSELRLAEHAAEAYRAQADRVTRDAQAQHNRHFRAVLELRRRRKLHTELMGYVGLLKQALRKAQRNLSAADAAVLRRFDEARAYCRELEHERRERTRQQERADELHRRLETAERDHEATAEALHIALRERDALDKERTRLAVELEVLGEHLERAQESARHPEDTK
ncbi:hypothetical protein SAMN05444354_12268 [Stigmatella aurantiaca]|uniref:Uncharacterized protein n=1 Tax=Stigmatella aurantiaca TaxID=41 RepID=A0A1H8AV89_STIAU|nr:hypothetical protein [Stigmatella aurantiaca]SEM74662.1 hypothetical protein SAMN05444354_12268 [Stigmatella aurantiaca]